MKLRCDEDFEAFAILICSETTKLNEYYSQKQVDELSLVTLIAKPDEKFTGQIFMKNDNLFASDLILDYLSKENLKFIQTQLEIIVRKYKIQCESDFMRQLYNHHDDMSTRVSSEPERGRKSLPENSRARGKSFVDFNRN